MTFAVEHLGLMGYEEGLQRQQEVQGKVINGEMSPTLILLQHTPVLTLGAGFHPENLKLTSEEYAARQVELHRTGRGGDVTYHGPGQLVAYPIFPLDFIGRDLHAWLRFLEDVVMDTLAEFGLDGRRFPPHTGVWIEDRKVCAMGIQVKRWVSMHGIALNCDLDLAPFDWIVPCGIAEYGVTSLTAELGRRVTAAEAGDVLIQMMERRCLDL